MKVGDEILIEFTEGIFNRRRLPGIGKVVEVHAEGSVTVKATHNGEALYGTIPKQYVMPIKGTIAKLLYL